MHIYNQINRESCVLKNKKKSLTINEDKNKKLINIYRLRYITLQHEPFIRLF
jgi:hypothetical protein